MEKPSKNEISKGSLYELLAALEWTMDDFEQADFSKEMHRTLSRQRHYQKNWIEFSGLLIFHIP